MNNLTRSLSYTELDDDLKEKVKEHFLNEENLVPYDWYEEPLEYLKEKYKETINFDEKSLQFDIYSNNFELYGNIYLENPEIEKIIPTKYIPYFENKMFYDVSDEFHNDSMIRAFELDEESIEQLVEHEIFTEHIPISFDNNIGIIDISIFKPYFEKSIIIYKDVSNIALDIIQKWLDLMNISSDIFFQTTIEIEESDYEEVISLITDDIIDDLNNFMNNEFYDNLDIFIDGVYNDYTDIIKDSYKTYFSEEYVSASLNDITYEVNVDDEGNQIDVVDLNGEF